MIEKISKFDVKTKQWRQKHACNAAAKYKNII